METRFLPAAPRPARGVLRSHGGRGLGTAHLRRDPSAASAPPCARAASACAPPCWATCPTDLRGQRVLDAGCGTGALAVEAARRGADVVAIDLSPHARRASRASACHALVGQAASSSASATCSTRSLGRFDWVVAMDSLIHYEAADMAEMIARLAERAERGMAFTFAPAYAAARGHAFRRKGVPAREPLAGHRAHRRERAARSASRPTRRCAAFEIGRCERIDSGLLHVPSHGAGRAHEPSRARSHDQAVDGAWARAFFRSRTRQRPSSRCRACLRLSLFQVSVGLALVLLNGTLNRVMIVELGIPAWLVAAMVALPILFAPFRALIGYRSDHHRSVLGWRRVPYIWMGTLIQFGGPRHPAVRAAGALRPRDLLAAARRRARGRPRVPDDRRRAAHEPDRRRRAGHRPRAPRDSRPRVVALLYVMLLVGMVAASLSFGVLLRTFDYVKLIKIIQGAAMVTMVLNMVALWKQEGARHARRRPSRTSRAVLHRIVPRAFSPGGAASRLLVAVGLGGAGFNMQDILLEPYGGELLKLSVSATTSLTALMAGRHALRPLLRGALAVARAATRTSSPRSARSSASPASRR